ncbi:MAG: lactate utilization protein [Desulfovibrionaceae bacterium]
MPASRPAGPDTFDTVSDFWALRLLKVRQALMANHFAVHVVDTAAAARALVLELVLPDAAPASVSFGGSLTLADSGLYEDLKAREDLTVIDTWDKSLPPEERLELRRRALTCDLFLTGTNAVTETGWLVNLDMIGNRVAALTFGPRRVVVLAGRNKIVPDVTAAIRRIKDYAAPVNAMRLHKKTPCAKTGRCHDCDSPDRICNHWAVTERCYPAQRITVILVNQDLGY